MIASSCVKYRYLRILLYLVSEAIVRFSFPNLHFVHQLLFVSSLSFYYALHCKTLHLLYLTDLYMFGLSYKLKLTTLAIERR